MALEAVGLLEDGPPAHGVAAAAGRLAAAFASDEEGIGGGQSAENIRRVGLDEDIPFCAQRSVLDLVPRVVGRTDSAVEISRG